jgi:hypothetical protein
MQMAPGLQFSPAMRVLKKLFCAAVCVVWTGLYFGAVCGNASARGPEWQAVQTATEQEKTLLASFDRHVKDYLKQRERVKSKLPALSKDATPEQINAHQKKCVESLRAMRSGTKAGYIFNPPTVEFFRTIIKSDVPPRDKPEIRKTILEADTKGVPLRVNYPYPGTKEFAQIPPTLLLKLPQLPKEVKYRYVGRHLLLVDTDNNLIVDYMLDALP